MTNPHDYQNTGNAMASTSKVAVITASALALIFAAYFATLFVQKKQAITRAEQALALGFGAVAAEEVDEYRYRMTKEPGECSLLISTFFLARKFDRLHWAAEKCLMNGIDTPDVYLGLASSYEFSGQDEAALQVLFQAMKKHEKIPELHLKAAKIFVRQKNKEGAAQAYATAARLADKNPNISVEAMRFFSEIEDHASAKNIADTIKTVKTEDPTVKLLIARALKKGGAPQDADQLVKEALEMVKDNQAMAARLAKMYPDLFPHQK